MSEILRVAHLNKEYSGVQVLRDFSLTVNAGEVHALIGHNGAGKSTVVRLLSGSEQPTSGGFFVGGHPAVMSSPRIARDFGIYTVFQELRVIDQMTISQNIFLGGELNNKGFVLSREMDRQAHDLLKSYGLSHLDVRQKVRDLSHAEKQLIEIVSAMNGKPKLLILDEPTTALQISEVNTLLETVRKLADQGVAFIFITHKIAEAFSVCSHVTILRNGITVSSGPISQVSQKQVLQHVVGSTVIETDRRRELVSGEPGGQVVLTVQNLRSDVLNVSKMVVERGSVLGLYGLVGSGRTELLETIFGARKFSSGTMLLEGKEYRPHSPVDAVQAGVFLLSEDRKRTGIVPQMSAKTNMVLASLHDFQRWGFVRRGGVNMKVQEYVQKLTIQGNIEGPISHLSGGNQQKVLIARWLIPRGILLMLDEPTKGVDIGVKAQIHTIIRALADEGYAVLVVSSEVEEIAVVSDRVAVMANGMIRAVLCGAEIVERTLIEESLVGGQR
ncbi:MAG: sugar ABC transporter ATP-binding protein [Sulfobacillus acidophilus]|uniref:Sugar ABC transporter ATP-binding protein n=1 Tax=Sulfobacillus acidophilus TaxID=53633 RepID=A0A2T2WKE9_9FIRM|nr:MAG: sugar ABC transporter ATP-binding protein [Sulfobacillus acidophilus]